MKRRGILGIVVVAIILGILLKRSVVTLRYRHEPSPSELATLKTNSPAQRNSPAGSAAMPSASTALAQEQPLGGSASRPASQEPFLPEGLQASVTANFPGYRVPEGKDIWGGWTVDQQPGAFSFLCRGDFNGDGTVNAAVILIGDQDWRFVILEKDTQGRYQPAFVARPKNKEELGKYWEQQILIAPQQLLLRTVKKGEIWAPEAGDDPNMGPMRFDTIEMIAKPSPNAYFASLIIFKEGKYQQLFLEPLVELPLSTQ